MTPIPAYLHPDTARELLRQSRLRRVRREAARAFRKAGWPPLAADELAEIHAQRVVGGARC